ncbi:MAG TPA: NAD-dependent epimerase/dehydratase family protein [Vicinamibacterales bacterium]|nr:NAD-dependent epimerase/dehydratase family protein [Vicinamibacterales bacterium]
MRVLVTGGTGYLGAAIVRALHARGHRPVAFARRASSSALPGVAIDGDIRDRAAVRLAADGVDAIVHAAALVSVWRPRAQEFDEVNVGGLHNVLETARALGVGRIVYTSSFLARPPAGGARPMEANDYQRTKVRARDVALEAARAGMPVVILVPGVIYGPGPATEGNLVGRLLADHQEGRLPGLIGAGRVWSYALVSDVADAHVTAVERADVAGEYLLGGENAPQMRVFEIVRDLTGRPVPRRIPIPVAYAAATVAEARARWLGHPPLLTRGVVDIFRRDWSMDSDRSIRELSYRITPLREGIRRMVTNVRS